MDVIKIRFSDCIVMLIYSPNKVSYWHLEKVCPQVLENLQVYKYPPEHTSVYKEVVL